MGGRHNDGSADGGKQVKGGGAMNARQLRPGACYWYTGRGRREMLRYRYRELDVYLFDSDDGQSVRLTAERVERYIQGRA